MDVFLLDTNVVSVLYDAGRPNHQAVRQAIAALDPHAPQLVSVITIGELRFGLALSQAAGQHLAHIEACLEKAEEHPLAKIGHHTPESYARVKSLVALQRLDVRSRTPRWVEAWPDRVTAKLLQIDENDLWIAAQAVERNYVVVTGDRDFEDVIVPAVSDLRVLFVA